jgi:hypothetical protein
MPCLIPFFDKQNGCTSSIGIIDGKFFKENGAIKFIDEPSALEEAQSGTADLLKTGGPEYLRPRSLLVKQFEEGLF